MVHVYFYLVIFSDENNQKSINEKTEILKTVVINQIKFSGHELLISNGEIRYAQGIVKYAEVAFEYISKASFPKFQSLADLFERLVVYAITVKDSVKFQNLVYQLYEEEKKYEEINNEKKPIYTKKFCSMARIRHIGKIGPSVVYKIHSQWFLINFSLKPNLNLSSSFCIEVENLREYFTILERRRFALNTYNVDDIIKVIFYLCEFEENNIE